MFVGVLRATSNLSSTSWSIVSKAFIKSMKQIHRWWLFFFAAYIIAKSMRCACVHPGIFFARALCMGFLAVMTEVKCSSMCVSAPVNSLYDVQRHVMGR